jgi:hypothetical protein
MYQPVQHLAAATRCATSIESNRSIELQCAAQPAQRAQGERNLCSGLDDLLLLLRQHVVLTANAPSSRQAIAQGAAAAAQNAHSFVQRCP